MLKTVISTEAAPGFPREAFDRAYFQTAVKVVKADPPPLVDDIRTEITGAAMAVVYRHRRAWEASEELLDLARQQRDQRGADWHFAAQTRLFDFFVSLHSTFESSYYGLYFAGGQLAPDKFPLVQSERRRDIGLKSTVLAFQQAWSGEALTAKLGEVKESGLYKDLAVTRNILAHRVAPGFEHRVTLVGEELATAHEINYELAWGGKPVEVLISETFTEAEAMLGGLWAEAATFFEDVPA
ncbi:hypothetical protein L1085_019195 [Streptomyces sp. MSC1_001]|jgi:hypothetical protein|uniref:hypothetical protein n=1 Tax=Streptomyces sp. MSC1_001 TaxID=2909263 RepID=UPI00202F4BBC|nr:hypothetical protein [Streptomyces sp. MSC1_001]